MKVTPNAPTTAAMDNDLRRIEVSRMSRGLQSGTAGLRPRCRLISVPEADFSRWIVPRVAVRIDSRDENRHHRAGAKLSVAFESSEWVLEGRPVFW
jgi:hypothetical protein